MTVLVTGGAGYIGSHMAWELLDHGEKVLVVDNLSTGFDWLVPGQAHLVTGDIGDADLLNRLFEDGLINAVIHFAGSIIVPESVSDPLKYYLNNTCNTQTLISACVRHGVKNFIFSSTAAVYGNPQTVPVREDAPLEPISPYGTSKLMSEQILRDVAAAHDFRYAALRYFNVAGGDPDGRTGQSTANATHLIKVACEAALGKRDELVIFGTDYATRDGTGIRDYIHVSDLVRAHRLALDHLCAGGDSAVLNCGYGHGASVLQVVDAVRRVAGIDFTVRQADRRPGDAAEIVAKADMARSLLGWRPQHDDLDTIVRHALDWERHLSTRNPGP
jgi:UDP-glucose 4-epimerase